MWREMVYVVARATRQFENVAALWKDFLENVQNRVAIAIARPCDIGAERIRIDRRPVCGYGAGHGDPPSSQAIICCWFCAVQTPHSPPASSGHELARI